MRRLSIARLWMNVDPRADRRPGDRNRRLALEPLEARALLATVYDFGTAYSPVSPGAVQVTYNTSYRPQAGYGWQAGNIGDRDYVHGTALTRDSNVTADGRFDVDLPNGTYDVTVTLGDGWVVRDDMGVILEGDLRDSVTAPAGSPVARTYRVRVVDGQLNLRMLDLGGADGFTAIRSLEIMRVADSVPIPELAKANWKSQMLEYGRRHADWLRAHARDADINAPLAATYYDSARVFQQIAGYTGDRRWLDAARDAISVYRDRYVLPNRGRVPGFWVFTEGLTEDYLLTGDPASREAVLLLASAAAYASDQTPLSATADAAYSREVAYILQAQLDAERLGAARRSRTDQLADQALDHLRQWTVTRTAPYVRPFMVGLTCEALIRYAQERGDARVLPAIRTALDWLWDNTWVEEAGAFRYTDVVVSDPDGDKKPAPDLNLLISPAFAWVHRQGGGAVYQERADRIFAGGVRAAWLTNPKHFNQNYRWSFDYVAWRSGQ